MEQTLCPNNNPHVKVDIMKFKKQDVKFTNCNVYGTESVSENIVMSSIVVGMSV